MIKNLISCFFSLIMSFSFAQDFQGKAYYKSKKTIDMTNFGRPGMNEDMKKRIGERMKKMAEKSYILTFNKIESLYKVDAELQSPTGQNNWRFATVMYGAMDGNLYKNVKSTDLLIEHELFGKQFLVKDKLPKVEWKITGETKQIGTYTCFKATAIKTWEDFDVTDFRKASKEEDKKNEAAPVVEITAWYTTQIPVNQGPGNYWGLPGLILEINDDRTTILCTKIVLNPDDKTKIKVPSKGKEVTNQEYVDLANKKMQEMRENFRRGRGRR